MSLDPIVSLNIVLPKTPNFQFPPQSAHGVTCLFQDTRKSKGKEWNPMKRENAIKRPHLCTRKDEPRIKLRRQLVFLYSPTSCPPNDEIEFGKEVYHMPGHLQPG